MIVPKSKGHVACVWLQNGTKYALKGVITKVFATRLDTACICGHFLPIVIVFTAEYCWICMPAVYANFIFCSRNDVCFLLRKLHSIRESGRVMAGKFYLKMEVVCCKVFAFSARNSFHFGHFCDVMLTTDTNALA